MIFRPDPALTFDSFNRNEENGFAFAAARAVLRKPGIAYSPVLIQGDEGAGKTHLLHAITHELLASGRRVMFLDAKSYVAQRRAARRAGRIARFNPGDAECDALLVDDVQAFFGFPGPTRDFSALVRHLHGRSVQIVLAGRNPVRQLSPVREIVSRLEWGMCVQMS